MNNALRHFPLEGTPVVCQQHGKGHIHKTWLVSTDTGNPYILQKINETVFTNIPQLMRNIAAVTDYLAALDDSPRHHLSLVPTHSGELFARDKDGCWRVYLFIADSYFVERAETARDFYNAGKAFGGFQQALRDFPAEILTETIPRFHDTPHRFEQLDQAVQEDKCGRVKLARPEIDFALSRRQDAPALMDLLHSGALPLRVTHNDTKINNVLFDKKTREPLCVIDLDTVMPGLAAFDFGDAIRFGASTAAEDERDLDKVMLSLDYYKAYAEGFLGACGAEMTDTEIDSLALGAKMMTLECGTRFLTDYLLGDTYFSTSWDSQNLVRARTQFKLVTQMETMLNAMTDITRETAAALRK